MGSDHTELFSIVELQYGRQIINDSGLGVYVLVVGYIDGVLYCFLVEQSRVAIQQDSLEMVGGGRDKGESSLDSAIRETKEELGLKKDISFISKIVDQGTLYPGSINSVSDVYIAIINEIPISGFHKGDGFEDIEVIHIPFDEINNYQIKHFPTLFAIAELKCAILKAKLDNNENLPLEDIIKKYISVSA